MKEYKVIFADLDGTLIDTISGDTFPKGIWDMRIRFEVLDKIKEIKPKYLLIVSNQGGIESGFVSEYDFRIKSEYFQEQFMSIVDVNVMLYIALLMTKQTRIRSQIQECLRIY